MYAGPTMVPGLGVPAEIAALIVRLREQLEAQLRHKIANPDADVSGTGAALIDGVVGLITSDPGAVSSS